MKYDLLNPDFAYLFGFIQTDGSFKESYKNKNGISSYELSIEISSKDISILKKLHDIFPALSSLSERTRDTNFKNNYTSVCLKSCDRNLAKALLEFGLPVGPKSRNIFMPNFKISEVDYWRGIIDGDGSLGLTNGKPYICLCTISDNIADNFKDFIYNISGSVSKTKKNKRDKIYNIKVVGQRAKEIVEKIYYHNCLSLERKYQAAQEIIKYKDLNNSILHFSDEDDIFLLSHSVETSMKILNRTRKSILYRIRKLNK